MKKDIELPKVEGVSMAIVHEPDEDGEMTWSAYLINARDVTLENVLISSTGYGEIDGEQKALGEEVRCERPLRQPVTVSRRDNV